MPNAALSRPSPPSATASLKKGYKSLTDSASGRRYSRRKHTSRPMPGFVKKLPNAWPNSRRISPPVLPPAVRSSAGRGRTKAW